MTENDLRLALNAAKAAVAYAQDVRSAHRKRSSRGAHQRETDISIALSRLKRAMQPIRAELARSRNQLYRTQLVDASLAIQRERRKLWKMQEHKELKRGKRRTGR